MLRRMHSGVTPHLIRALMSVARTAGVLLAALLGNSSDAAERLRAEPSAFIQASAASPVDWRVWGEEAFALAKKEQKPIIVWVGAFTHELSGAMRRQTFALPQTAAMLNEHFVCVLIDRDERPDLAALFQAYVREIKQSAGWPLNLWLTPELQPYEGAAYLPPSEEWGKPGFLKVATQAEQAWRTDPAGCRARAAEAVERLRNSRGKAVVSKPAPADLAAWVVQATEAWRQRFDPLNGGFGDPPKNPEPELLRFLLTQAPADREATRITLEKIAHSALRDPLDGGFFRSAADAAWNVPVLQKTLVDQARLALAYLAAAAQAPAADAEVFRGAARGALDYALTRLALPDGSFAAAEDATDAEFAGYYTWTAAEIDTLLGKEADAFKRAYGVESGGNVSAEADVAGQFAGKNLLRWVGPADPGSVARLRAVRERRPAPPRDNRATAGAHGWLLAAFARAGTQLGETRFTEAAERLRSKIEKDFLSPSGEVRRFRGSPVMAAPTDYAGLALGFRELAKTRNAVASQQTAERLWKKMDELFSDATTGRYAAFPENLPPGIFFRAQALADPLGAEAQSLLAAESVSTKLRDRVVAALLRDSNVEGEVVPGDVLLALAAKR